MTPFFAVAAPLAPATDTTALARPLLPPTTTFSMSASLPHFSTSLLTLSLSTCGAPLYFTSASMVPPPCAVAVRVPATNATPPTTSATPAIAAISLRITNPPSGCPIRVFERRPDGPDAKSSTTSSPSLRHTHHEQHRGQCEEGYHGRNHETPVRLRLLQPQIVP